MRIARSFLPTVLVLVLAAAVPATGAPPSRIAAPLGHDEAAIDATLRLPAATWLNDRDGDKVFDSLEARFARHPGSAQETVVTLRHGADVDPVLARAQAAAGGFTPTHVWPRLAMFAVDLRVDQALAVAALEKVRQVEWIAPGVRELDTATANGGVRVVHEELVVVDEEGNVEPRPITGEGVIIGIMDSGFHGQHIDLAGQLLRFIDWGAGGSEPAPYDDNGHGTHVASIALGLGAGQDRYRGVAPGAKMLGFKIDGGSTSNNVLSSVNWMLEHLDEYPVRVTTISYGFGTTSDGTSAMELAFDRLYDAGVLPFKSTGNSGPERGTVTIPGGARGIVATAAMNDPQGSTGFHLTSFSSRGPTADGRIKPDLAAYGNNITAAQAGTTGGYTTLSGTSMASPYAAGVAALVFSANPDLTNTEVRDILYATAEDWGPAGPDIDYGNGRIRALDAVIAALEGAQGPQPDVPAHDAGEVALAGPADGVLEAGIDVLDASRPLHLTVIVRGRTGEPAPTARALLVQLMAPGGAVIPVATAPLISRQALFQVSVPVEGRYVLRIANLTREDVVSIDASAAEVNVSAPL